MVIDTSALIAILLAEPEFGEFVGIVTEANVVRLSAASYVGASMVLRMRGRLSRVGALDEFLTRYGLQIEPLSVAQAKLASAAFADYGKGIHPASLNYGDCFTYALAKTTGEPLLFKGNDFAKTDLESALKPLP